MFFILKKEIGIMQKVAMVGVFSAVVNAVIITITFMTGFDVSPCDNGRLPAECHYTGMTGIRFDLVNWF